MSSRPFSSALLFLLAAISVKAAAGQTHHVAPPEKVTRAVAVYEWTGDLSRPTASRLVPVSLFINGHFEDAGLYLARPVPFALEPGDLYSVEQAGEERGTLSLEHAGDFTAGRLLADQEPIGAWYGFGRFAPLAPPKPAPALHASAHPPVIVSSSDSGRPHFGSKPAPDTTTPADKSTDTKPSTAKPDTPKDTSTSTTDTSAKTPMGDDPDRPTLNRRTGGDSTTDTGTSSDSTPQTTSSGKTSTDNDPERPSLRKRNPENTGKKSPPTAGVTGPDRSLNDDPDRPTIRHGKTPAQEEDAELKTLPADLHQVAAVSDPARREPHVFAREWESPAERADVLTRLQTLARAQVTAYLTLNHLTPGAPPAPAAPATTAANNQATPSATASPSQAGATDANAPTLRRTPGGVNTATSTSPAGQTASKPAAQTTKPGTTSSTHKTTTASRTRAVRTAAVKPAPGPSIALTAEQLNGYTLTYGGLSTFVYTAQVPVAAGGPVYVTVVAQRLPSGEFQVSLHSVTDATHLDRSPWMRPIDAVDPDASHRGSLLFELRAQSSRQFALYRLISAQAEQQFVSQPIQ